MTSTNGTKTGFGIGPLIVVATIVLAGLKLASAIEIGWLGVFAPLLIWFGITFVMGFVHVIAKEVMKKNFTDNQRRAYNVSKNFLDMDEDEAMRIALKQK